MSPANQLSLLLSGERTSLPPKKLQNLVDALCEDPLLAIRLAGFDPASPTSSKLSDDEIKKWVDILDDARDFELMHATSIGGYLGAAAANALAVGGLAVSFTGPVIGSVVATISLGISVVGGISAIWTTRGMIREDLILGDRLRAIERAQGWLLAAAKGFGNP